MNKRIIAIASFFLTLIPLAAKANQFDIVHRWTDSVAGKTYIFIPAQTTGEIVTESTSEKVYLLNNCGDIKIKKSPNITNISPVLGGLVKFKNRTQVGENPGCLNGTSSWSAPVGNVVESPTDFFIKGSLSSGNAKMLRITKTKKLNSKANDCGFLRISTSDVKPMTTFKVGATNYTLDSLPTVTNPMICKKIGATSTTYTPL
jgi:hypothetical protein